MKPEDSAKCEYRRAQREVDVLTAKGHPEREYRRAQRKGASG
jgi:hypothetical protein